MEERRVASAARLKDGVGSRVCNSPSGTELEWHQNVTPAMKNSLTSVLRCTAGHSKVIKMNWLNLFI